jgi:phosphohistidine swiveling domain-containing protein
VPTGCIDSGQAMAVDGSVGIVILQNGKEQVQMNDMVLEFSELTTEQQSSAGGKGGVLAKLYQAGYPVPEGFVVLPGAFTGDKLRPEAWAHVQTLLKRMRDSKNGMASFAVRSSALSEDSAKASFAGEFETVLDVHSDDMIRAAIRTVRRSRHSERVQVYSQARGIAGDHDMAVVVQRLIRADISGVLFTADPVTGSRVDMVGNFVFGFGEELVSGEAEPYAFTLQRPKGRYEGASELNPFARSLYELGIRLEQDMHCPQDIEWAIAHGKLFLLQSRPITTLIEHNPATVEWNATLTGDYLWSNLIVGEVFPTATTPSTWSVWKDFFDNLSLGDMPSVGNIAGRPYLNYSLLHSFLRKLMRTEDRTLGMIKDSVGVPPEGLEIPAVPIPWRTVIFQVVPREFRNGLKKGKLRKNASEFLPMVHRRCRELDHEINETQSKDVLIALWVDEIRPLWKKIHLLQDGMNESLERLGRTLKGELTKLLGEDDTQALMTTISGGATDLTRLGPLGGLSELRSGTISHEEYLDLYGHRGSNENELAEPRPCEDPGWLDRQLAEFIKSPVDIAALMKRRSAEFEEVRRDVARKLPPREAQRIALKIDEHTETNAIREATRSELTRLVGVIRTLLLRAGELTGLDDGIFFLTTDEIIDVLSGDASSAAYIPDRRETYEKIKALPPLPAWIKGRFDPFQWAADPHRRMDVFDDHESLSLATQDPDGIVKGHPGSAGRVEGVVRRINSPDEGELLGSGEILVTCTTNIGWTPLFPRAAAIVTDIGGSLSHAAIVAREIGIPAVVGCRTATMRLKTGDRVLVDGGRGTVEILETAG